MRGYTLIELVAVLLIGTIVAGSIAPVARRYRDRAAVVAARESVAGLIAEARGRALLHGQASIVIDRLSGHAAVVVGGVTSGRTVSFGDDLGVHVPAEGPARREIAFGPLGLGRFANATIAFRRGREQTELIVSSFGRIRRR